MTPRIETLGQLGPEVQAEIQRLVREAPEATDNPPISEQGLLRLRSSQPVRHLLAWAEPVPDGTGAPQLLGYAQLDEAGSEPVAELLASDPGTADALIAAVSSAADSGGLRLWAHGAASVANQAALRAGWEPVRTLLQLRRSLTDLPPDQPRLPDGITLRPFVIGQDEAGWLAVNRRAFAHHPEQGGWTEADLADRLSATWFDPAGFLLADRAGPDGDRQLLGYHWTKVHPKTELADALGEVYVLGIDPAAQGLRLGTALLAAGLRHLQAAGLDTVLLYVDESNAAAVHLYGRAGFTIFATDIQYRPR